MGDKTQLLSFALAARFKKPLPILAGIFVATLLNHGLAAGFGTWLAAQVSDRTLRIALGLSFLGFALWTLKPDTFEEGDTSRNDGPRTTNWTAFTTTTALFFVAEMGDKTQFATVGLAARFQDLVWVTAGTTAGMLIADGMAVFVGQQLGDRLPMDWIRRGAALLFAAFGLAVLFA